MIENCIQAGTAHFATQGTKFNSALNAQQSFNADNLALQKPTLPASRHPPMAPLPAVARGTSHVRNPEVQRLSESNATDPSVRWDWNDRESSSESPILAVRGRAELATVN
jgi:hypothetical protein